MRNSNNAATRFRFLKANADRWNWPRALLNVVIKGAERYLGIHINVVRVREIPADPEYPDTNPDLIFRRIKTEELLVAAVDPDLRLGKDFTDKAISRGDLAFGAFDGSVLVSYIWRAVESAPDAEGVWVRVQKPYNYSYNSYTRPTYRGQRISPVVHLFSDNEMRKLGYEYRTGFVAITNYASLRMGRHMGSKKIGYAGYFTWFGRLTSLRSRAVKEIGFEFFQP